MSQTSTPTSTPRFAGPLRPRVALRCLPLAERSRIIDEALRDFRIRHIREQIEAGTYETPMKLDLAVQRMLDDLGGS